jgi:redox-sensitive bicupin YhaK (pirin superfamily)
VVADVVSGTIDGKEGLARNQHPIQGAVLTIEPGRALDYAIPASHRAFLYVLAGEVTMAGRRVREGQVVWSDPVDGGTSSMRIAAIGGEEPARVLTYSGAPLREPVVMGGPFVMNSRAQIENAHQDFHAGRFGQVPRQARLKRT